MKTKLWMLGMAVAALTSCTQSEVVEMPESKVIGFNSFVNNQTRAVVDITKSNMGKFWLFGYRKASTDGTFSTTGEAVIFSNVQIDGTTTDGVTTWNYNDPSDVKYWIKNSTYRFAAYNNGGNNITADGAVGYNPNNDVITFTNYQVEGKDLVATISGDRTTSDPIVAGETSPVMLNFHHMLSKIRFSFTSSANVNLAITNLVVNAATKGTGTYTYNITNPTSPTIAWTPTDVSTGKYSSHATLTPTTTEAVETFYVIPQSNQNVTATFTLTSTDSDGHVIETKPMNVNLTTGTLHNNTWMPGYLYNYIAVLGTDFNQTPITFTVNSVSNWTGASDSGTNVISGN